MCSPRINSPICKIKTNEREVNIKWKPPLTIEQIFTCLGTTKMTIERTWKRRYLLSSEKEHPKNGG
jgi:hypothetical protein